MLRSCHHGPIHGSLGPLLLRVGTLALQGSQLEETSGGCSLDNLGWVQSDETLGTDVVVRGLYCDLGNVGRIVEIWRMNKSKFSSGRNRFCRRFHVFCLLSVKVCSWYKTHSKTGNFAGVRYVSILSVPGIQFRPVCCLDLLNRYWGIVTVPGSFNALSQGTWGGRILTLHLNYVAGYTGVTVSFEAFSGHKTMMYTLKVVFTILNNLIRDRGLDCNCIINGRVELLVESTLRRLRSKILYFIPRCHGEKR